MDEEIQRLTTRLAEEKDTMSARMRKRIYQKIGKLKIQVPANPPNIPKAEELPLKRSLESSDLESQRKKAKFTEDSNVSITSTLIEDSIPEKAVNTTTNYTKKDRKALLHLLNKEMKECAIKKQLNRAKKAFRQHCAKGLPVDVHTYSSLLNCYIRCQDVVGGKALFETIPEPNLVTYTIMLRGYCESGLMQEASELFFNRMIPSKQWNIRSLNTFLRGCLRTGFITTAVKAFEIYQSKQMPVSAEQTQTEEEEDEPDAKLEEEEELEDDPLQQSACFESMVSLLTRSGRIPEALQMLKQYLEFTSASSQQQQRYRSNFLLTNAALTLIIARFLTIFGYFSEAKKYLLLTEEILSKKDINAASKRTNSEEAHQKSVQLFQKFQKAEIRTQIEQCEEYLSRIQSVLAASSGAIAHKLQISESQQMRVSIRLYESLLQQVFYFGFQTSHCDSEEAVSELNQKKSFSEALIAAMVSKFGWGRINAQQLIQGVTGIANSSFLTATAETEERTTKTYHLLQERNLRVFPSHHQEVFVENTQTTQTSSDPDKEVRREITLDLFQIFQSSNSNNTTALSQTKDSSVSEEAAKVVKGGSYEQSLEDYYRFLDNSEATETSNSSTRPKTSNNAIPVCLEIGSGNGDWIVAQAAFARQLVEVEDLHCDHSESEEEEDEEQEEINDHSDIEKNDNIPKATIKKVTLNTLAKEKEREKQKHLQKQANKANKASVSHKQQPPARKSKKKMKMKKVWTVKSNWIALELRYDRCSNILSNHYLELALLSSYYQQLAQHPSSVVENEEDSLLQQLPPNNLAIFSGDAKAILSQYLPKEGLAQIFINYPQPPERITAGMHGKDQGKHLYTPDLLTRMIEILQPHEGKLTILSDNLLYIQLLATNIHQISEEVATRTRRLRKQREQQQHQSRDETPTTSPVFVMMSEVLPEVENVRRVQEILPIAALTNPNSSNTNNSTASDPPAIIIYRGDPGPECGHQVSVSSYFDRMWTLGQKKRRWYLHLVKTAI